MSVDGAEETDGRRRRSLDSKERIVAAMLDLVRAGDVTPSAEQVAARAEVGLRTVFRHFRDMDSLYREMFAAIEAEFRPVATTPFKSSDWQGRVVELIARRSAAFDAIAPFKRAADAHRHRSPFLAGDQAHLSRVLRGILVGLLPPEIARDGAKLEMLDLLLSYEAWSRLRNDQNLTPKRAREVLEAAVRQVIG